MTQRILPSEPFHVGFSSIVSHLALIVENFGLSFIQTGTSPHFICSMRRSPSRSEQIRTSWVGAVFQLGWKFVSGGAPFNSSSSRYSSQVKEAQNRPHIPHLPSALN